MKRPLAEGDSRHVNRYLMADLILDLDKKFGVLEMCFLVRVIGHGIAWAWS